MNTYRTKFLFAMKVCPIVLWPVFAVASASAQTRPAAPAKEKEPPRITDRDGITLPPLPVDLEVGPEFVAFFKGHGIGTQNYVCRKTDSGFAFVLFTPQATLFNSNGKQLITHFFSPDPFKANTDSSVVTDRRILVTWQDSRDTSTIWAAKVAGAPAPVKDAVDWLKLEVIDAENGPTGGDSLTPTKLVLRVNTFRGVAPSGCDNQDAVGKEAFVPYEADYFFFRRVDQ